MSWNGVTTVGAIKSISKQKVKSNYKRTSSNLWPFNNDRVHLPHVYLIIARMQVCFNDKVTRLFWYLQSVS